MNGLPERFTWPEGKRCALSLTFDDARPSQLDNAIPVFERHGVLATFYVSLDPLRTRADAWRRAAVAGHEIGNHTRTHPCSGNFGFVAAHGNALETYTLERMERELIGANREIRDILGLTPITFAYPCGQAFVGRGVETRSVVPLVARHFLAGRSFRAEAHNAPGRCDLAQLFGVDADGLPFERLKSYVDDARAEGGWLILCAHDVDPAKPRQAMTPGALDALCTYARDPANGIWIDTVAAIATFIDASRKDAQRENA